MNGETTVETPNQKEYYEISKRDTVYAIVLTFIAAATVILSLWGGFNAGFTIGYIALFITLTLYLRTPEKNPSCYAYVCGALAVLSSVVFSYTNNFGVNFFLLVVLICLSAVWFASLTSRYENDTDTGLIVHIASTVFGLSFGKLSKMLRSVFSGKNSRFKFIVKGAVGLICAIPLLATVILLLLSADVAFAGVLGLIGDSIFEITAKLIIGFLFAPLAVSYAVALRKGERTGQKTYGKIGVDTAYLVSFMGVLGIVYIIYLVSQLAYFSNAFGGIIPDGYTPAQYARKGFFEISIISGINFAVIFTAFLISKKKNMKPHPAISAEIVFISVFTLFLISTAIAKMVIYIDLFGMTELRIVTSAFMIFIATVFISIIFRCFIKNTKILKIALISATCILLILGFGDVDKFVADYNVGMYTQGHLKTVDIRTLKKLGTGGIPALDSLTNDSDLQLRSRAKEALEKKATAYFGDGENTGVDRELGDWVYTDHRAEKILEKYLKK